MGNGLVSKSFEDIFVETLLGRIVDREAEEAAIQVEIDDLTNDVYQKGTDAGVKMEQSRIIALLEAEKLRSRIGFIQYGVLFELIKGENK